MSVQELDLFTYASLTAAFFAAASGSLHCVVMCGPLRMLSGNSMKARFAYQAGRGFAYLLLGALAGSIGALMPLWSLVILIAMGLLFLALKLNVLPAWPRIRQKVLALAAASPFLVGLSSGLLPCGLLHGWILAAAATKAPVHGALFLGILWVGTLPALELSALVTFAPLRSLRLRFPRALPISLIVLALAPILWRSYQGTRPHGAADAPAAHSCHSSADPELSFATQKVPAAHDD